MPITISGTGTIAGLSVGGLTDGCVATADLANSAVTSAKMDTSVVPIGVGQTWQDVLVSRAAATTYTNSTGRPIMVAATAATATWSYIYGYVDGVMIIRQQCRDLDTTTSQASALFIVPSGSTYRVEVNVNGNTTSLTSWFELR